jgi:hypothetical protein
MPADFWLPRRYGIATSDREHPAKRPRFYRPRDGLIPKREQSRGFLMELLRQFRFDRLEGIATEMLSEGMDLQEVTETFVEYLDADDASRDGWKQKGWMTLVDGFYRNAIRAVEIGNLHERDFFLSEAWKIMLPRHGMM